jgi:Acetokinase family
MKILVCNAGSSSFKFSFFEAEDELLLAEGSIDWTTKPTRLIFRRSGQQEVREELKLEKHADAVVRILDDLRAGPSAPLRVFGELQAVGHRVVHGGERYTAAVRITPEVKQVIAELAELAPLHNPASLDGITAVEQVLPNVPQVAAFDTAFHATLSPGGPDLSHAAEMDMRMGYPPLRLSRAEPLLLCRPGGRDHWATQFTARDCPPRQQRVGIGGPQRCLCRYFNGLYALRRSHDGHPQRHR